MKQAIRLEYRDRLRHMLAGEAVGDGEFLACILNGFGHHLGGRLASEEFCKEVAAHLSPAGVKFCRHLLTKSGAIEKEYA